MFRPKSIEEAIARIIFENIPDIDGDEADWLFYKEDLIMAAQEILRRYPLKIGDENGK